MLIEEKTMRRVFLGASALAFAVLPASAQQSAPVPIGGRMVEVQAGTPVEAAGRVSGLPGVGMDLGSMADQSPKGPGGLQNGVGAYGVMAPDASGTAGNTLTRVPGSLPDAGPGLGIPISSQGETLAP